MKLNLLIAAVFVASVVASVIAEMLRVPNNRTLRLYLHFANVLIAALFLGILIAR